MLDRGIGSSRLGRRRIGCWFGVSGWCLRGYGFLLTGGGD